MPLLLTSFFLGWVGLGLGSSTVHNNIYIFPNPTEIGIPGIANTPLTAVAHLTLTPKTDL